MAPVNWLRGPWQTQQDPYGGLMAPQASTPVASPYERLTEMPTDGGGYGGGPIGGPGQAAGFGPYGSNISNARDVALGLLGGPPGWARAAIPAASLIARGFGLREQTNPFAGQIGPLGVRDISDYQGDFAARDAVARNAAIDARVGSLRDMTPSGGPPGGPSGPAGYGEDPGRASGDLGPGDDSGGRDAGSAGDSGTGTGGESGSGYVARGGVFNLRGPKRFVGGEAGPEDIIAIPQMMRQPGMQGNEMQVRRGLTQAYRSLVPQHRMGM